jgi:predicted enzyme related to lactoylglutathione lyase
MGLFSKRTATATASPDGSVPAEGKGSFFGRAMRDAIGQIKAQGGFNSGLGGTPKTSVNVNLIDDKFEQGLKKGGKVKAKKMAKGGSTASKRADGCATKGKTKGRII